jgi:MFS transporter, PPP family, 3-phenylpropionic acid transporter
MKCWIFYERATAMMIIEGGKKSYFAICASYFFVLLTYGIFVPFFPLWLASQGFAEREIGYLLAIPLVMRVIATTPLTWFGEQHFGTKFNYVVCSAGVAMGFSVLLFSGTHFVLAGLLFLSLFWAPIIPLLDTIAVRASRTQGFDYGQLRQWGSISYFFGTVVVGLALNVVPVTLLPVLLTLCALCVVAFATRIVDAKVVEDERAGMTLKAPFEELQIWFIIFGVSLLQASHAYQSAFSSLTWQHMGFSSLQIGFFWAASVLSESVFFFLSGRYLSGFRSLTLVTIGGGIGCMRWCFMALEPSSSLAIVSLQLLHCFSFGAVQLGTMRWLSDCGRNAAPLQAASWAMTGGVTALATAVSGFLYSPSGMFGYIMMTFVAFTGILVIEFVRYKCSFAGRG